MQYYRGMASADQGLRERKKQRTRRDLRRAAYQLFDDKGYDATTIAEIAKAAEVSAGTFFNYFGTKEDLVFGERAGISDAGIAELRKRLPEETPADAVARSIDAMLAAERRMDPNDELGQQRARLVLTVPSLHATALHRIFDWQQRLATELAQTFRSEIDQRRAAIVVGAFVGASMAGMRTAITAGEPLEPALRLALDEVANAFRENG